MFRMVGGDKNAAWKDRALNGEAVILNAGVDWNGVGLGVAYDITVSELIKGNQSRGAFEVGLTYIGKWKKKGPSTMYCPRF